jgi:hypothetical protein
MDVYLPLAAVVVGLWFAAVIRPTAERDAIGTLWFVIAIVLTALGTLLPPALILATPYVEDLRDLIRYLYTFGEPVTIAAVAFLLFEAPASYGYERTGVAKLERLPERVPQLAERTFLEEALACYKAHAFRATTVMVWNLAFDHVLRWLLADPVRLAEFNKALVIRYPRKTVTIAQFQDFDQLKESEVIDVCRSGELISKEVCKILRAKLDRRNAAAHPSLVVIGEFQASDAISDLVDNVVLRLA